MFREGDQVVFVGPPHTTSFTYGKTYEVGGYYHTESRINNGGVGIKCDNNGNANGWAAKFFKLSNEGVPW